MITRDTVFVLGAGASHPYGMPLGSELRDQICAWRSKKDSNFIGMLDSIGFSWEDIRKLAGEFQDSAVDSIDRFLGLREEHLIAGKYLIAHTILECEHRSRAKDAHDGDWYRYLWNRMLADVDNEARVRNNRIKFLTFNYDRTLEFFLYKSFKNTFNASPIEAQRFVDSIPIAHLYGSVGAFLIASPDGKHSYGEGVTSGEQLAASADSLRVMEEDRLDSSVFQQGRDWFANANQIIFLGFGFDELNCSRLKLSSVFEYIDAQRRDRVIDFPDVFATTYEVPEKRAQRARVDCCGSRTWKSISAECRKALEGWDVLL
jgi:hypothetical protein